MRQLLARQRIPLHAVLAAVLVLPLALVLAGCSSSNDMLAAKNTEIDRLKGQVDQLQGQLDSKETEAERNARRSKELEADLKKALADLEQAKQLSVKGNRITMPDAVLFRSGSTALSANGKRVLDGVAKALKNYPEKDIQVEGHTDTVPIGPNLKSKYPTNWELSTARALSVVYYLNSKMGVTPSRMAGVGKGPFHPVATNDTAAGRAKNRRAVIVLTDR